MPPASPFLDVIRRRYPDALGTTETVLRLLALMQSRLGLDAAQILLADSICSDDLNNIEYPREAYRARAVQARRPRRQSVRRPDRHGGVRPPRARRRRSLHLPRPSHRRRDRRQHRHGAAARAATAVGLLLAPHQCALGTAACAVAAGTDIVYQAIERRIDDLLARTRFPCRHVVVMGGVLINSDHHAGSFCSFRASRARDVATGGSEDWLPALRAARASMLPSGA